VPQVVQPQVVGQRIGAVIGVELGDGLVGGSDGRLEAVRDELGLPQRPGDFWRGLGHPDRSAQQVEATTRNPS
jgi:hypothetical protein